MALFNMEKNIWKSLGEKERPNLAYHAIINITKCQFKLMKIEESEYKENYPIESIYCFGGKNNKYETTNSIRKLTYDQIYNLPYAWEDL